MKNNTILLVEANDSRSYEMKVMEVKELLRAWEKRNELEF